MMDVEQPSRDSSTLLPSQFFAEENDSFPVNNKYCHGNWKSYSAGSSDFGSSSLSSTVDSELGYAESDNDVDDEYAAELTRQMAQFMFLDDDDDDFEHRKAEETPIWSKSQQQSQAKSDKLESNEETQEYKRGRTVSITSDSVHLTAQKPSDHGVYFQSKQALIDEQIRAFQLSYPKKEQNQQKSQSRKKKQNRCNKMERRDQVSQVHDKGFAPLQDVSKVNLQDQQKTVPDKEAVNLGETGSKTGSCGTGVFLPRRSCKDTFGQSSKKTGCSTVIIPARVAQALKLHFDQMGPTSRSNGAGFPLQQDASTGDVRYLLQSQPTSRPRKASSASASKHQQKDMGLPQEWTY